MLQSSFLRSKLLTKVTSKQVPVNQNWAEPDLRQAGKEKKQQENPLRSERLAELTERILSSYQSCGERKHSAERSQFIDDLAGETKQCLTHMQTIIHKAKRAEDAYEEATATFMQDIFELMRSYAFEFNSAVAWNELNVTCTKPGLVTEVLRYSIYREPIETVTSLRSRLSTRHFSLVMIGRRNTIEFILMPVHKVIGLAKSEAEFAPLMQFNASYDGEHVTWFAGTEYVLPEILTAERLDQTCRDLFRNLVETSRLQTGSQIA